MSILSLKNISRNFGEVRALRDISLEVAEGELRAVIGPNGAGKTTLFNLVSGAFPPSAGEITFKGELINGLSPEKRVHAGIVRTFQITEVFPELEVFENLRNPPWRRLWASTAGRSSHAPGAARSPSASRN